MLHSPNTDAVNVALRVLNEALMQDPRAMRDIIGHREICNQRLALNDTIQVRYNSDGAASVGVLGIINGVLGVLPNGRGPVAAELDDNGNIVKFVSMETVASA